MWERLRRLVKRESAVALRTLLWTWLVLTLGVQLLFLLEGAKLDGVVDALLLLTVGSVVFGFYTFWPACAVTACRVVYRLLGWGVFAGAFLAMLGVATLAVVLRHVFGHWLFEVFAGLGPVGPCGAHAGGPGAVIALVCLLCAIVTSPASLWALLKIFLAAGAVVVVGSLPGTLLWLALLLGKVAKLASARISR